MSVQPIATFSQVPPKRPGEADVLNGTKENATSTVPPQMPAAEEYMQIARLLVAAAKMIPVLRLTVIYTGTVPSLAAFASVREDLAPGDFAVAVVATGSAMVTWPAGKFPTSNTKPMAAANDSPGSASATAVANGVSVNRRDAAGASVDQAWTVEIF